MPNRFKLLILDYGGVYSFGNSSRDLSFNTIISETFGRVPSRTERQKITESARLLGENKITVEEHVTHIGEILSVSQLPTTQQFEDATIAVTSPPSSEMIALVKTIRDLGTKVSLLSDMYMFEVTLTKPWGRYDGFDFVSLSAEAGMTKHNPEFFNLTLAHFGLESRDALFVDDAIENIEVAKSVGLATLFADKNHYVSASQLAEDIHSLLVSH